MAAAYFYRRPRRIRPAYHALLRDDLYFYPPRFPIPRPALRHHEVPHRKHFKKLNWNKLIHISHNQNNQQWARAVLHATRRLDLSRLTANAVVSIVRSTDSLRNMHVLMISRLRRETGSAKRWHLRMNQPRDWIWIRAAVPVEVATALVKKLKCGDVCWLTRFFGFFQNLEGILYFFFTNVVVSVSVNCAMETLHVFRENTEFTVFIKEMSG